ncbi:hypothetical protein [Sphingobacterium sp. 1.A.5]|uniref:hypothetical protein n=1 Tax=Sphingobacterium sp. 1.A.5 TaxID=2044604 RepID=UPI0015D4F217|nr:hypothetical protein [Sphingobacterium sp. 1.A.5]
MDNHSKFDIRDFVTRYALWLSRAKSEKEAIEYAEKILKDNPDILKLVLEDIKASINNK